MTSFRFWIVAAAFLLCAAPAPAGDGNRLAYLEENNPWYPHTGFARLTTPQWVGDEGVEAVVILAIDDMRDTAKYEAYLRPILQRLKAIDGRAPVSIMACDVRPDDPQLQSWLGEGLSIECHTVDHPCPLLQGGDFEKARSTYDRCIDLMHQIPGNTPVAFRTPCCDSLNTVSPRFFSEIFNARTHGRHHLQIDSSVFCVFTDADPDIPTELLTDPDGTPKFTKYLPTGLERGGVVHNQFVNWIENYPYPYVINNTCWEFPCMVPSDWEANFHHQPNNPDTVRDMNAALDITVLKQGVFCMVFHPHGWIRAEQMVEFIDRAVETYGEKVKFLSFREALARLNENLLDGHPLRSERGHDNGVRVLDTDNDGYLDVVIRPFRDNNPKTRVWSSETGRFEEFPFPSPWTYSSKAARSEVGVAFGVLSTNGRTSCLVKASPTLPVFGRPEDLYTGVWGFDEASWSVAERMTTGLRSLDCPFTSRRFGRGMRLLDIAGDGTSEIVTDEQSFHWADGQWEPLGFALPSDLNLRRQRSDESDIGTLETTVENGVRFEDLNSDDQLDVIFSNHNRYGIWLFKDMQTGWSIEVMSGTRGEKPPEQELPPIIRADGTDNGFFLHSGYLLWQNEDTAHLPDMVEKRPIAELLESHLPE